MTTDELRDFVALCLMIRRLSPYWQRFSELSPSDPSVTTCLLGRHVVHGITYSTSGPSNGEVRVCHQRGHGSETYRVITSGETLPHGIGLDYEFGDRRLQVSLSRREYDRWVSAGRFSKH